MSYRIHNIGILIRTEPREAVKEIRGIIDRNKGNVSACADDAGVDRRTFNRWVEALDAISGKYRIRQRIEKLRSKGECYRPRAS